MALINCPNCNGKASDKAAACPHCGSTALKNPVRIVCPECDSKIQGNPAACPVCGFPIGETSSHEINLPGGGSVSVPTQGEPITMRGTPAPENLPPPFPPPPSSGLEPTLPPPPGDAYVPPSVTGMPFDPASGQLPPPFSSPEGMPDAAIANPTDFTPPPPSEDPPPTIPGTNPHNLVDPNPEGFPPITNTQPVANYMLGLNNNITGPHTLEEIQTWQQGGMLPPDTPCMAQGDPQWNTVADVLGMPTSQATPAFPGSFPAQPYPNIANAESFPETKPVALIVIGIIYLITSAGFAVLSVFGFILLFGYSSDERSTNWLALFYSLLQFVVTLIIAVGAARSGIDLVKSNPNENARASGVITSIALIVVCVALIGGVFYLRSNDVSSLTEKPPLWPLIILLSLPIPYILTLTFLRRANVQQYCQSQK